MQNDLRELAEQQDGVLYIEQVESWIEEIVEQLEEYEDNYTQNKSSDDYELGQFSMCEHVINMLKGCVDNAG